MIWRIPRSLVVGSAQILALRLCLSALAMGGLYQCGSSSEGNPADGGASDVSSGSDTSLVSDASGTVDGGSTVDAMVEAAADVVEDVAVDARDSGSPWAESGATTISCIGQACSLPDVCCVTNAQQASCGQVCAGQQLTIHCDKRSQCFIGGRGDRCCLNNARKSIECAFDCNAGPEVCTTSGDCHDGGTCTPCPSVYGDALGRCTQNGFCP